MSVAEFSTIVAAVTALVAVAVGPLIQLRIAKRQMLIQLSIADRQFRASVISSNRQAWINELRSKIAKLLATAEQLFVYLKAANQGILTRDDHEVAKSLMNETYHLVQHIRLMLNANESPHCELDSLMSKAAIVSLDGGEAADGELISTDEFETALENISRLSRSILKSEWERVKTGD